MYVVNLPIILFLLEGIFYRVIAGIFRTGLPIRDHQMIMTSSKFSGYDRDSGYLELLDSRFDVKGPAVKFLYH